MERLVGFEGIAHDLRIDRQMRERTVINVPFFAERLPQMPVAVEKRDQVGVVQCIALAISASALP